MKKYFKNHNWIITFTTGILLLIGISVVYSTTYFAQSSSQGQGVFPKHLLLVFIGIVSYFVVMSFDYRFLKEPLFLSIIYIATLLLLLYARFFSAEISETTRWIKIGPFSLQPAEFAKITIMLVTPAILFFSKLYEGKIPFYKKTEIKNKFQEFIYNNLFETRILICILLLLPIIILIATQPALGTSIISLFIMLLLIIFAYPNKKELYAYLLAFLFSSILAYVFVNQINLLSVILGLAMILFLFGLYKIQKPKTLNILIFILIGLTFIPISKCIWKNHIKPYQKSRIESFLDPQKDPQGQGWQVNQAQIAVGSAGIFGKGFMQGTQSKYSILPFAYTDFAFAGFYEQFGLVGGSILLLLLLFLCHQLYTISKKLEDPFASTLVFGAMCMVLIHTILHIGMNVAILPVTGIPLPLISYGGSSIIVHMITLGIVQNTLKYQRQDLNTQRIAMQAI